MTPTLKKAIEESRARAEEAASVCSDDFGHSVQDCLEWQARQLDGIANDTERLCAALEVAVEALKFSEVRCREIRAVNVKCHGMDDDWADQAVEGVQLQVSQALAAIEAIMEGKNV